MMITSKEPTRLGETEDTPLFAQCPQSGTWRPAMPVPIEHQHVPAQRATPTSAAAADSVRSSVNTRRRRVLAAISAAGQRGLTDQELECELGWPGNSVRARRRELEKAGLIGDGGERRATASGRKAIAWIAVLAADLEGGAT